MAPVMQWKGGKSHMSHHRLYLRRAPRSRRAEVFSILYDACLPASPELTAALERGDFSVPVLVAEADQALVERLQAQLEALRCDVSVESGGLASSLLRASAAPRSLRPMELPARINARPSLVTAAVFALIVGAFVGVSRYVEHRHAHAAALDTAVFAPDGAPPPPRAAEPSTTPAPVTRPDAVGHELSSRFDPDLVAIEMGGFFAGVFLVVAGAWASKRRAPARASLPPEAPPTPLGPAAITALALGVAFVTAPSAPAPVAPPPPTAVAPVPVAAAPAAPRSGPFSRFIDDEVVAFNHAAPMPERPFASLVAGLAAAPAEARAPTPVAPVAPRRRHRSRHAAPAAAPAPVAVAPVVDEEAELSTTRELRARAGALVSLEAEVAPAPTAAVAPAPRTVIVPDALTPPPPPEPRLGSAYALGVAAAALCWSLARGFARWRNA
ncbi:MAG: hypothetical protein R3A52_01140 [Polyangiales bacterium]